MKKEKQTQSSKTTNKGFTLIELLVVVLIIGILAAIALPQYKMAVERSRAATIFPLLKAIVDAQDNYFLIHGTYTNSFDELSVDIPFTGREKWATHSSFTDVRSNNEWSIQLGYMAVYAGRLTGTYEGSGFAYYYQDWKCPPVNGFGVCAHTLTCVVKKEKAGGVGTDVSTYRKYCSKIFGATKIVQSGTVGYFYAMP